MKKVSVILFTLAAVLAIPPGAIADTLFNFSYVGVSGNNMSFSGTFVTTPTGVYGVYDITSITNGVFTDTNNILGITSGPININSAPVILIPDGSGPATILSSIDGSGPGWTSPDGAEVYDNVLYYPGNPYYQDSWGGILFTADGYEIDIAQYGTEYGAWVSVLGNRNGYVDPIVNSSLWYSGEPLSLSETEVKYVSGPLTTPEPSSLLLLCTGLLGLAIISFRKYKPFTQSSKP
ncbi:MAG TPA: PEP-CTERM sorting domain-containing protein [Terracidiphilus sp.]|nr:PEP-CTERM sorting domain-containing protein [Terracidiphilus sp.]